MCFEVIKKRATEYRNRPLPNKGYIEKYLLLINLAFFQNQQRHFCVHRHFFSKAFMEKSFEKIPFWPVHHHR